jgi:single-stranded DNA-binding protein
MTDNLHKEVGVYIERRLQMRKWQDKNNINQYTTTINANERQMLVGKNSNSTDTWATTNIGGKRESGHIKTTRKPYGQIR